MKKIAILTYHRVYNFGSLLQTYALQETLKNKGCSVEVIDYYPERLRMKKTLFHVNQRWRKPFYKMVEHLIPAVIARLLGYHMMNVFLKHYINLTSNSYIDEQDLVENIPLADIYLNGSDQVWNLDTADGEVDKVFFMGFLPDSAVKAAYAGSFGQDSFSEEKTKEIGKYLGSYKMISVREKSGLNILHNAGIDDGEWVLDPSFLLNKEQWMKIAKEMSLPEHYLLIYNLNRNPRISNLAKKIAKERNLKIVNFAHSFVIIKGEKNVLYPTPNTFITMFANADYVVTDSFHGTAFSINFNRQFICVSAPRFNSRLKSVLGLVGLEERLLGDTGDFTVISKTIDYTAVNSIIDNERKHSEDFLNRVIEMS